MSISLSAPLRSGRAPLAALDPRIRVGMAVGFALTVVALSDLRLLICACAISFLMLGASPLAVRPALRRMVAMDGFILVMLVLLPFTVPGTPAFTAFGFLASWEGLHQAASIALTANAVVLALMALVGSLEPVAFGHALHALKCPRGLVHLMMFTIRYLDVLGDEYAHLRRAMKVRGFRPASTWHSYRSYGYLVGMMLVRALERSERIMGAMKCRGFTGELHLLYETRLKSLDLAALTGCVLMCLTLLGIEIAYGAD